MNSNDYGSFSKYGQRKVSSFVGQEMLFDYMTGQLDSGRKKAVEEFIKGNQEAQSEIQKIQSGLNYLALLAETQVSEPLKEKIKQPTTPLQIVLQKIQFSAWPPPARIGLEACLVAFGITAFAVLIPWTRLLDMKGRSSQVVLSEIDNQLIKKSPEETELGAKEQISFPDEGSETQTVKVTTTTLHVAKVDSLASPQVKSNSNPPSVDKSPSDLKPPSHVKPVVNLPASSAPTPSLESKSVAAKQANTDSKTTGFLYRGVIKMTNPKAVAPKIVEKMSMLGARKAGNVELGWSKGSGAYYHFTLPESKYEETLEIFREYGELKIQKEKHERLMPDGIIRLIIEAEEKR